MPELLPKSHRIVEKGMMEFRPFGKQADGVIIQDVSGITVRANLEYLQTATTLFKGPLAGETVVQELVKLLNEQIPDRAFHVTPEFLNNPWNSYSYEFVMYLTEFCIDLSGDPHFHFHLGREKFLSPIIQVFGRPFSIIQIYKLYPYFVEKFTRGALLPQVVSVTNGSASMRLRLPEKTARQFGPYLKGCAERICQTTKATIAEVPARMFGMKAATIEDRSCIGDGAEYCEWVFTWQPQGTRSLAWISSGMVMGLVVLAFLQSWYPDLSLGPKVGLAILPVILFWIAGTLWRDQHEIQERGKIIQEQLAAAETRHGELSEAYFNQEHILVELRRRIGELTMLHQTGLRIGSTLERDTLLSVGLEAIIRDLHYKRALIFFYDPERRIVHGAHVQGIPSDMAAKASVYEMPISDIKGLEADVLVKGVPLLMNDVQADLHQFHPATQQLLTTFETKAFIAVPLKVQNRILGALVADRLEPGTLTDEDLNVLVTVTNQIAIALDNAQAYAEIEQLNIGLEAKVEKRTAALHKMNQELEAVNDRLKELDRLKSTFLSHCSHELRTPLTSIKGFTENLLQGVVGGLTERQHLYLSRINANADRLTRMIADLLDLSRIESGTVHMVWEEVDLPLVVEEVIEQMQFLAQQKDQTLQVRCREDRLTLTGDNDRLHQVVTNLVHNALKFTPEKGTISLEVQREGDNSAMLTVSDTGSGVPPEALSNLFQPFFQAHRKQEIGTKGLGLGLAIVKNLVDLHGGAITVQSEVGKGTTFQVTLPLRQNPQSASLEASGEGQPAT